MLVDVELSHQHKLLHIEHILIVSNLVLDIEHYHQHILSF